MGIFTKKKINREFFHSVCRNQIEEVENCLKLGANVNSRDDVYLHSKHQRQDIVFYHPAPYKNQYVDKCGRTALGFAVLMENVEMVKLLIERGADVNLATLTGTKSILSDTFSPYGITPLMEAAERENNGVKISQILIENGANIEAKNSDGETALMLLADAHQPNFDLFKFLIKNGADIETVNNRNQTVKEIMNDIVNKRRSPGATNENRKLMSKMYRFIDE